LVWLHDVKQARDTLNLMRFDPSSLDSAGIDRHPPTRLALLLRMLREYQARPA